MVMKRTEVTDCRNLPFDLATVYAVLVDFAKYPRWWPSELRLRVLQTTTELVGSRFEVRPQGGSFICQVTQVIPEKEMLIRYVEGFHRGTGLWLIKPQGDGTRLCYQ